MGRSLLQDFTIHTLSTCCSRVAKSKQSAKNPSELILLSSFQGNMLEYMQNLVPSFLNERMRCSRLGRDSRKLGLVFDYVCLPVEEAVERLVSSLNEVSTKGMRFKILWA